MQRLTRQPGPSVQDASVRRTWSLAPFGQHLHQGQEDDEDDYGDAYRHADVNHVLVVFVRQCGIVEEERSLVQRGWRVGLAAYPRTDSEGKQQGYERPVQLRPAGDWGWGRLWGGIVVMVAVGRGGAGLAAGPGESAHGVCRVARRHSSPDSSWPGLPGWDPMALRSHHKRGEFINALTRNASMSGNERTFVSMSAAAGWVRALPERRM